MRFGVLAMVRSVVVAATLSAAPAFADSVAQSPIIPAASQSRLLSIGGDVTEILDALGYSDRIVAVDSTSKYPESALKTKANVGYMRALATEGVLSVNPTAIIASLGAGPSDVVKALKASSIPYVEVPDDPTAAGVSKKIRVIGAALAQSSRADALAASVEAEFEILAKESKILTAKKRAIVILSVQNGRAIIGGANSSADAMLALAGADNAAVGLNGFQPVSDEQLAEFAPDAVIVMRRTGEGSTKTLEAVASLTGLQSSPANRSRSVIEMDGLFLLGFGPRTPAAVRDLRSALYPDTAAPPARREP